VRCLHAHAFRYANQGGVFQLRDVDDAEDLMSVRHAMRVLGFDPLEVANALSVAASLLHLGEFTFDEDNG